MRATLNTVRGMNAYITTDRASWLKFCNKRDMKLLFSGDPTVFNQYAYLPVNPQKHLHVKVDQAQKLIGETLYTPNANVKVN